jgi:hypothetical protein
VGNRGALVLLTGFQTPAALRAQGVAGLEAWLRSRNVRGAAKLAAAAVARPLPRRSGCRVSSWPPA